MILHGLKTAVAAGAIVLGVSLSAMAQSAGDTGAEGVTNQTNATDNSATSPNPSEATAGTATEAIECSEESFATIESQLGSMTDTTRRAAIEQELTMARQYMSTNEGNQCAERLQGAMGMMGQ